MFDSLTEKLLESFRSLAGKTRFSEEELDEVCRKIRTNLLEADVHVKVVKDFIETVRKKASEIEFKKNFSPEQEFIRIVYEELAQSMGKTQSPLNLQVRPPAVFLMVGLQGSGKTTSSAKLARYLKDTLKKEVLLTSLDIYRPAAIEQLKTLAENNQLSSFDPQDQDSVRERALLAKEEAIKKSYDVLILDSAGRLHIDQELMEELSEVYSAVSPNETILVMDGMIGQDAVNVASQFQEKLELTGIILTKLDGDTRGGAALSLRAVTGLPIKFMGTGEKAQDLEVFHPDRLASRILDMGDLLSLAEKAQKTLDPTETLKLAKKVKKNDFTLADFFLHLQQIKKMGSFENLLKFIPGMGQISKQIQHLSPPDTEIKKIEAIILSMTPEERVDHSLLDGSRRKRIAGGSGTKVEDINRFIKQFLEAKKLMSHFTKTSGKRKNLW